MAWTPSTIHEMQSFLAKFRQLTSFGMNATLTFNHCDNNVQVTLQASLGSWSLPVAGNNGNKPSRIRRRKRRQEARNKLNADLKEASNVKDAEIVINKTVNSTDVKNDECKTSTSPNMNDSLPSKLCSTYSTNPLLFTNMKNLPPETYELGNGNTISDVLSADHDAPLDSNAIDHAISKMSNNQPPMIKCGNCQKVLETIEDIRWHNETRYGQENCRILKSML